MFSLAWRNVVRHVRRSLITIAAVALGLAAMIFLWGFNDGIHNHMMRNLQQTLVGSVQIHAKEFFHHPDVTQVVPEVPRIRHLLQQQHISSFSYRLWSFALAAGQENSEGLLLLGLHPDMERLTTDIADKVSQGRFFTDNHEASCVLGKTTARLLGVSVGDTLVLLSNDKFSALAAEKVTLVGIIDSGEMGIDRGLAIVPLGFMQDMLSLQGQYSAVVIQLPSSSLEHVTTILKQALDTRYEVLRWYDMYPMMKQWVELENAFYYIFLSIVLLIITAGIMNTVLMSMLERIHEFGVMMALGCERKRLGMMVVMESLMLGMAGVLLGLGLGLALVYYFHTHGIDLSSEMDTMARFYINPVIYTEIDTEHLVNTVLSVLGTAVLASIWPAVRASRLDPVEAMHHV